MKRPLFCLSLFLVLALFVQPVYAYLAKGEPAPDFELVDATGKTIRLSDFTGRIVVLKLGTTTCSICKVQTRELEADAEFLNSENVVVMEVFLQDTQEMVDRYLSEQSKLNTFVPLLDEGRRVRDAYFVSFIPRLLLIDQQMKVHRDGGVMDAYDLKMQVQELLDQ